MTRTIIIRETLEGDTKGDAFQNLANVLRECAQEWKELKENEILAEPMKMFFDEVIVKTPKSTFERYGKNYPNYPNFGLMAETTEMNIVGSSRDLTQYRISVPAEYAEDVYDYPPGTNWTTPGTGERWIDWAWDTVKEDFITKIEANIEQALGNKIEDGL